MNVASCYRPYPCDHFSIALLMDGKRREGLGSLQPLVLCEDVPGGKSAQCLSAAVCADLPKEQ